jgi:hypothetical protein
MKKIYPAHFGYYRNEAHYDFMLKVQTLLLMYPALIILIQVMYDAFTELLDLEGKLIDQLDKSDYTAKIRGADKRLDRCLIGMRAIIASGRHHYSEAIVDAATKLYNRFQAFGNIHKKSYKEERAAVKLLLLDLTTKYELEIEVLEMKGWVEELTQAENEFSLYFNQREAEDSQRIKEKIKNVRKKIDLVYHNMAYFIDSAATVTPSADYNTLIALLNVEINYSNDHTHQRARKDITNVTVAEIPTQKYTEKAITPLPQVFYTEEGKPTVELVFAKDFTVTYRKNIKVGTATISISGKGAYKGIKKTNFNIARTV